MTMLPLKTAISDTYPNPSNATARAGFATLWDALNEFQQKSELDLASAATCDIGGQGSTKLRITGTTGITSFGTNYRGPIMLRFSGAVTLTHDATTLICPGATNLTTAAGDALLVWPVASVSGTLDGWKIAVIAQGGVPTAPTAAVDTSTTQLATTAFVTNQAASATPLVAAATAVVGTSKRYARGDHVHPQQTIAVPSTVNTTSGTSVSISTSIPSWAKRVTLVFFGVSTNGTSGMYVRIGTSSGLEATGYTGESSTLSPSSVATSSLTTGFLIRTVSAAASVSGTMTFHQLDSATNKWVATHLMRSDVSTVVTGSGDKALSGALTRVSLLSSDTFDAGAITIMWE